MVKHDVCVGTGELDLDEDVAGRARVPHDKGELHLREA
jgi:hypothetical protein